MEKEKALRQKLIELQKDFLDELQNNCSFEELQSITFVFKDESEKGFEVMNSKKLLNGIS